MDEHAVVIAGGGPTGLMLASELRLAGIDVAIVERRPNQDLDGLRAGGLHIRTIELLDQRGIADRFISQGQIVQRAPFARTTLNISDLPTRHSYFLALWQTHIERILAEWVSELGVAVYRGCEVTEFAQDDGGVDVRLSDGRRLRAQYLVGCDGGRSLSEREVGERNEPTVSDIRTGLIAVYGTDFGLCDATHISRFTDMTRQAATYRDLRVLLAGDAAHVHSPMGGQGLNLGVQDAVNLGWKLAQVVKGVSPESLLDTYHSERHPAGARVLRNTMALTAIDRSDDRVSALREMMCELLQNDGPRRQYLAMMSGLDVHYDLGGGHPLLGRRMPDLDLVTADGPVRVFTLLHRARPVLLNLGERGGFDIAPWAQRVQLVDAKYDGAWELPVVGVVSAPTAVLIRPDGYVAWVGEGSQQGLVGALTAWFGLAA